MHKRPLSVTIISWLFIAVGVVGLVYHSTHLKEDKIDTVWILFLRVLALVCAVSMLFRQNWARWVTAGWLAYHVYLSLHHKASELIIHTVLFIVIAFFLFRPAATAYFRGKDAPPSSPAPDSTGYKPG